MREAIHPEYKAVTATCSCGNAIEIKSTLTDNIQLDVCSECHPFYTGKQKLVDTGGRVDKFRKRFGNKSKTVPVAETPAEEVVAEEAVEEETPAEEVVAEEAPAEEVVAEEAVEEETPAEEIVAEEAVEEETPAEEVVAEEAPTEEEK